MESILQHYEPLQKSIGILNLLLCRTPNAVYNPPPPANPTLVPCSVTIS